MDEPQTMEMERSKTNECMHPNLHLLLVAGESSGILCMVKARFGAGAEAVDYCEVTL